MDFERLGPYEIGPRIGKGGMGSVYRGTNTQTGEPAAIKALAPQLAVSEGFRDRFDAEIESLKTLKHEGIVRLIGYGEEHGTLFYAMELVEGRSLEEELKAGRRFHWREVIDIAIQVCRALKHAHDHGIIHRDIKPANILLDGNERVKLADFGIARLFGGTQLTVAGGVLGTADYMSPEQAEGKPVTNASDQYSLGGVMYALLAGRPPFRASSLIEMLQLQRFAEPEPVKRFAPDIPDQLGLVVMQLLSKRPEDRFPNTLVLSRHLEAMRRALSRPTPPEGTASSLPSPGDAPAVPLDMAVTQADDGLAGKAKTQDSDFDVAASIDRAASVASSRDMATIASQPTLVAPTVAKSTARDHFTAVGEQSERSSGPLSLSLLASMIGLVALVGGVGWLGWRLAQPPSADELYAMIRPTSEEPTVEHLRGQSRNLAEFLTRHAEDPRAAEVAELQRELDLDARQKQFVTLARGRGDGGELLLSERLYLEALQTAELQPGQAARQIEQLLAMYPHPDEVTEQQPRDTDQVARLMECLELARRALEDLKVRAARQQERDLAELESRLAAARQRYTSDPAEAVAICEAIVAGFADRGWAAGVVDASRAQLETWRDTSSTASDHP